MKPFLKGIELLVAKVRTWWRGPNVPCRTHGRKHLAGSNQRNSGVLIMRHDGSVCFQFPNSPLGIEPVRFRNCFPQVLIPKPQERTGRRQTKNQRHEHADDYAATAL